MFTGLILETGCVLEIEKQKDRCRIFFRFLDSRKPAKMGESIAVNGVCLTVAHVLHRGFAADLLSETLRATNLGGLHKGARVHLERALRFGDPMGGHFVTGHVDTTCLIESVEKTSRETIFWLRAPLKLFQGIVPKGSVALDGVSLTVQDVEKPLFKTALIPHTLKKTQLGSRKEGDLLNLEVDMLSRYRAADVPKREETPRERSQKLKRLLKQGF